MKGELTYSRKPFIHSFIPQTFIKHVFCAKPHSKCWGYSSEWETQPLISCTWLTVQLCGWWCLSLRLGCSVGADLEGLKAAFGHIEFQSLAVFFVFVKAKILYSFSHDQTISLHPSDFLFCKFKNFVAI